MSLRIYLPLLTPINYINYNRSMMKLIKTHKGLSILIGLIIINVIFLIILFLLKTNSNICESWTVGFSRWYESTLGPIFKWLPFSYAEVLIIGCIIAVITLLIFGIIAMCKRKFQKGFIRYLSAILIVISIFTFYQATAEMGYNRSPIPLQLYEEKVDKSEFVIINEYFISDLNEVTEILQFDEEGEIISPYSLNEMNDLLAEEFPRLEEELGDYLTSFTTRVKPMVSSFLYREFHITGVTFMPTTEANINYLNVNALKPFTYAHEIFHTKGVMREEDADLLSIYLMLTSKIPYFRYSGYYASYSSLQYLASLTGIKEDYKEVTALINNNYKRNKIYGNNYWAMHNSYAEFADWVNDMYLKISGVKEGTASYSDTQTDIDKQTEEVINFSLYQKLYFKIYYAGNN